MVARLRAQTSLAGALDTVLNDVIAMHGAEHGTIQLVANDVLRLVGQRRFPAEALREFQLLRKSDGTACARALRSGRPVLIENVEEDAEFSPFRAIARRVGFRAVQATPLIARDGTIVGVVSTHFANKHRPTAIEMQSLDAYSTIAAEHIARLLGNDGAAGHADIFYERMLTVVSK
jgi:GAF domain-containing protein